MLQMHGFPAQTYGKYFNSKAWIKFSHVKSLVSIHSAYPCKNYVLMYVIIFMSCIIMKSSW